MTEVFRVDRSDDRGPVVSPVVRRLASSFDIDLTTVVGTGPDGRITRADIQALIVDDDPTPDDLEVEDVAATTTEQPEPAPGTGTIREVAQFTSMIEVDAGALLITHGALVQRAEPVSQDRTAILDGLLLAVMAPVLGRHRLMNARLEGDEVVYCEQIDIGVACDGPDGEQFPVVSNAAERSFTELSRELMRLRAGIEQQSITADQLGQPSCTIRTEWDDGPSMTTPVLQRGTSTAIAVGPPRPTVRLVHGVPAEIMTMTVSATFDHRLIDGGDSGRFLADLKQHVEIPALGFMS